LLALLLAADARAFSLTDNRNFEIRARLYTEAWLQAEKTEPQTHPAASPMQLVSHKTFFNPEFEGRLTS
jgi:hypothetical protein